MKILVLGANGFIGKAVVAALSKDHEVFSASRQPAQSSHQLQVDLLNRESISKVLDQVKPEVIINCAGVVENSGAAKENVEFTKNLLDEVVKLNLHPKAIVICGSAAEYGVVNPSNIPVKETAPLNAANDYGLSKKQESLLALEYKRKYQIPVSVLRIFNPIGSGMHAKFIIPGIMRQIIEIQDGKKDAIEVSRLDSKRDYIDVADIALAIKVLVEGTPQNSVYNLGSGKSTSNAELIEMMVKNSRLKFKPAVKETFPEPEATYAIQADITRLEKEFGWHPQRIIEETVKEVMNDARRTKN